MLQQHSNRPQLDEIVIDAGTGIGADVRSFMANVFAYMFMALLISGVFAWWFGTTDMIWSLMKPEGGMTIAGWVVTLAPLGFILLMSFRFDKMSSGTLLSLFIAFAAIMGISLSFIFVVYQMGFIATTFAISAATFAIMAVVGYTTKTDLTKLGSILMMGLIGIILASVINMFLGNAFMDYVISIIGVLIFTGLTAYDTQKLKRIGMGVEYGSTAASKLAVMGALSLYLDFVNLFLFLLRALSSRE